MCRVRTRDAFVLAGDWPGADSDVRAKGLSQFLDARGQVKPRGKRLAMEADTNDTAGGSSSSHPDNGYLAEVAMVRR